MKRAGRGGHGFDEGGDVAVSGAPLPALGVGEHVRIRRRRTAVDGRSSGSPSAPWRSLAVAGGAWFVGNRGSGDGDNANAGDPRRVDRQFHSGVSGTRTRRRRRLGSGPRADDHDYRGRTDDDDADRRRPRRRRRRRRRGPDDHGGADHDPGPDDDASADDAAARDSSSSRRRTTRCPTAPLRPWWRSSTSTRSRSPAPCPTRRPRTGCRRSPSPTPSRVRATSSTSSRSTRTCPRNVGVRVVELTSAAFPQGSAEVLPPHAARARPRRQHHERAAGHHRPRHRPQRPAGRRGDQLRALRGRAPKLSSTTSWPRASTRAGCRRAPSARRIC